MKLREQLTNSKREKRTVLLGNTAMSWLMVFFLKVWPLQNPGPFSGINPKAK